jgi:hypothetical protein
LATVPLFYKMGLIDQARLDIQRIVSNPSGFGQTITLTAPNGTVLIVVGLHKKIRLGVDTEGNIVNTKTATITLSDNDLVVAGYPYRDSKGEVQLGNHKVSVSDITGNQCLYVMQSWHPDETLGIIVCYLQDFE